MTLNAILASEFWESISGFLIGLWNQTGIVQGADWRNYVMILISFVLFYLAIVKKFEPLLMLPIAFGMFIVNVPGAYGVLFGTKGYIVTDTLSNNEVARGSLEEIAKYFGYSGNTDFKTLTQIFKEGNCFVLYDTATNTNLFSGTVEEFVTLFNVQDIEAVKTMLEKGGKIILEGSDFAFDANKLVLKPLYVLYDTATKTNLFSGSAEELVALFNVQDLSAVTMAIENGGKIVLNGADFEFAKNQLAFYLPYNTVLNGVNYTFAAEQLSLSSEQVIGNYGLFYYIYKGVDWVIFPPIIFLGIGCMTDFGPLIANPKSMLMGAAAQLGIFITFFGALCILGYSPMESGAIAIIGGADGPTAIYVAKKLAEDLLPAIAISAYSYMALIPVIQKPIMKLLTTDKERRIKMTQLRTVSKLEKIVFPIAVSLVVGLLLPDAMPLLGMLMLGNLLRESGVTQRLSDTAQNGLMNTITIFLGVMVGSKAIGSTFLDVKTLGIILLGLFAFCMGTVGGLLCAKIMNKISGGKINPLIGSAGVSAVPMAARISQDVGREYDPDNHLLMHAMGPNVAGVIGSAIAAGVLLAVCPLL